MIDYLEVDGIRLECRRLGEAGADQITLVLLHEGLGCVEMWRDFPERLAQTTGLPVLAYSRLGYGRSDPKPEPWPLRYMHDEALSMLPEVLRAADLQRVMLVGHSDGASIALIHAGGVANDGLEGLILMAPHVFNEEISVRSIAAAKEAYLQTALREKLRRYHGDNVDNAFWGWNKAWLDPGFLKWNIEEYLPKVAVPVLVVQGEDDQYGTARQVEAIRNQVPAPVTTRLLAECRHSPYIDQPEETLSEISAFLGNDRTP